jgi:hypothetical protein
MQLNGFTNQASFLLSLGLCDHLKNIRMDDKTGRWLHSFLLGMGRKLKVLIQRKDMNGDMLRGVTFPERLA